jgi:excisionase family DNA binding protein
MPDRWRLAKISDAAAEYGLQVRYVRRLVEQRQVATVKLGRYRLIDLDSLDRLLAQGYTPEAVNR